MSGIEAAFEKAVRWLHGKRIFGAGMMREKPVRRLMEETAAYLAKGIERGIEEETPSEAMVSSLRESAGVFSGFKTFHEMKEAAAMLLDERGNLKPFEQFSKDVQTINEAYNKHYLRTEYNFAVQSAQMAARWEDQQDDGGGRYLLQYRTAGDSKVRPAHQALNGITLPASDPFWDKYYPPNGFNCFPAGTLVLMGNGEWKSIEQVNKGESVIGGSGQRKFVTGTHVRAFNGEMACILTKRGTVSCTPNHRFLTARGWVSAGELQPGDILIQVGKVGAFDVVVNAIHNMHALVRNGFMSLIRKRESIGALTINGKIKFGQEKVHDITSNRFSEIKCDIQGGKEVGHDLFAWTRRKTQSRKVFRMRPPGANGAGNGFLAHIGAEERGTCFQFFRDLANQFTVRFGFALSDMFSGKGKFMIGLGKSFARGFPPFRVVDPLRGHGLTATTGGESTMPDQFGDTPIVDSPQGADISITPKFFDISKLYGIPNIHTLDSFHPFYKFVGQTFLHTEYILVIGKSTEKVSTLVYNLSVEEDESYVIPVGIVHNCRCTVAKVRAAKYPATDSAEAMKAGDKATEGKYAEMFRFNPGKRRAAYPAYNSYTIAKCATCKKNGFNLAKVPSNELCAACPIIRECAGDIAKSRAAIERKHYLREMKPLLKKKVTLEVDGTPRSVGFSKEGNKHLYSDTFGRSSVLKKEDLAGLDKVLAGSTYVKSAEIDPTHPKTWAKRFHYFKGEIGGKTVYLNVAEAEFENKSGKKKYDRFLYSVTDKIKSE